MANKGLLPDLNDTPKFQPKHLGIIMKIYFAPTGYVNICDAARIIAKIPEYNVGDGEYLDTGDYLEDAAALDNKTKEGAVPDNAD